MKKRLSLLERIALTLVIWLTTIALVVLLTVSPDLFWFHYSGYLTRDVYTLMDTAISLGSFFGIVFLILGAIALTTWIFYTWYSEKSQQR